MLKLRESLSILPAAARRRLWIVIVIVVVSSIASAGTIASIMPFLSVISDPQKLEGSGLLARAYSWSGVGSPYQFLIVLGVAAIALIIAASALQMLRVYAVWHWTSWITHTLSCKLLSTFLRQPYEFFLTRHSADLTAVVLAECDQVVAQVYKPYLDLIAAMLTITAILGVVIWLNPTVAITTLVLLGCIYGTVFWLSRRGMRRLGKVRVDANKDRYQVAGEAILGIKHVKIRDLESRYLRRFKQPSSRIAEGRKTANVIAEMPRYVLEIVALGGVVLLCLLVLDRAAFDQSGDTGQLVPLLGAFAFAAQRLLPELQRGFAALTKLQYGAAGIQRLRSYLSLSGGALPSSKGEWKPIRLTDQLELEGLQYTYVGAERPSLADVSLTIRKGERIGIVGSSGAGKSTLVDVLLGLLEPERGTIRIDGEPLISREVHRWRHSVGYVPQEIFLTDATLAENIAFGLDRDEIDDERLKRSALMANLASVVERDLPDQFETRLGDRGVRLSGGQRQRIGIARALYHDADLIIFDEATSALDNVTEAELIEAIRRLPGDKTIIIIAHRLSTVRGCDRLIVMEQGRLIGSGTWDQLLETNETFRGFVERSQTA